VGFFRGLALEHWSERFTERETAADVAYLLGALSARPGARLLDVPCGDGRHLFALAARGYRMTGIDIAAPYIRAIRRRAGPGVTLVRGDMADLRLPGRFDGAYSWGNSFGYLDRAGSAEMIRRIAATLRPGARFVLDTSYVAESIIPNFRPLYRAREGRFAVTIRSTYDARAGIVVSDYRFAAGAETLTAQARFSVFTLAELSETFARARLEIVATASDLAGRAYALGDPRVILVAQRLARHAVSGRAAEKGR